jgi:ABC-2 type transport system permease protein
VSAVKLTLRQARFTNKSFWRNPASAFFTFAFPLMFLVIFTSLLGKGSVKVGTLNTSLSVKTYYVVAMATFGVISACYTNIAISVSFNRDAGILKRTRGTPLPSAAYMGGRVIHATLVGLLLVVITCAFGALFYHASIPTGLPLLEFLVTLLVGSLSFVALALALTTVIPNADAAPAIVNASILPLFFLSGIFIPLGNDAPAWIRTIGKIFPVKHFADALRYSFLGNGTLRTPQGVTHPFQLAFSWTDVLFVAAWGLAGLVIAASFFSWEPSR